MSGWRFLKNDDANTQHIVTLVVGGILRQTLAFSRATLIPTRRIHLELAQEILICDELLDPNVEQDG